MHAVSRSLTSILYNMGGLRIKTLKSLAAVHGPPNTDLALGYIQGLIKCSCSSGPPCVSANCGCCVLYSMHVKSRIVTEHKHMEMMMMTIEVMMTTKLHI